MNNELFAKTYCHNCGTQRCEGIGTEWFEGCKYKWNHDSCDATEQIEWLNQIIMDLGKKLLEYNETKIPTLVSNIFNDIFDLIINHMGTNENKQLTIDFLTDYVRLKEKYMGEIK